MRVRDVVGVLGEILFSAQLTGKGLLLPPTPVISSFNPLAAEVGDTVTIFGTNLGGATAVRIGTLGTSFTVVNDAQITADVTGPPRLVPISVITPSGIAVSAVSLRVIFVRPRE